MLWSKFIPAHQPELSGRLGAYDFTRPLVLTFEVPGAVARFDSGFARREGAAGEWLVAYTEHCGYPVFPFSAVSRIDGEVWDAERRPAPWTEEDR
jgi:hypothetical protein